MKVWRRASRINAVLASALWTTGVLVGCSESETGGVSEVEGLGSACIPSDEYSTSFSGFHVDEVNVDRNSPHCGDGGVCLVNHFQGRVSCPYGQLPEVEAADEGYAGCTTPVGPDGAQGDGVTVPVSPQLKERQAAKAVYCSCRCADIGGKRGQGDCSCPSGYSCEPLVADLGLSGGSDVAGSYCVKAGTAHDELNPPASIPCQSDWKDCGPEQPDLDLQSPQAPGSSVNTFVESMVSPRLAKLDLLLVVDNSLGMGDKQALFVEAASALVRRLLGPLCLDPEGNAAPAEAGSCPAGSAVQSAPIRDLHIGVISSSLGAHGGRICSPDQQSWDPEQDDRGELLAPLRGISSWVDPETGTESGFLKWDPDDLYGGGITDEATLVEQLTALLNAVGQSGCGYEAPLEAWYRFLVDPEPPLSVVRQGEVAVKEGVNEVLLQQRKLFLRPDSVVAVVMLSDENDCSIQDSGYGWIVGESQLSQGTTACDANPNDNCCTYCGFASAPAGCPSIMTDPKCQMPKDTTLNTRCWEQKRRFGIDFLYPTSRYSTALDSIEICPDSTFPDADCNCRRALELGLACDPGRSQLNPLYTDLQGSEGTDIPALRDPSLVLLAGIVGVPWQDLATDESRLDPDQLVYRTAGDLDWNLILGDPRQNARPTDPFMVESVEPRTGLGPHPVLGEAPAPPDSSTLATINGHEYLYPDQDNLQYACTFPLGSSRECTPGSGSCPCPFDSSTGLTTSPLCLSPDTGEYGPTQYFAPVYPGLRLLDVLKSYGYNSVVASACPKITDPDRADDPSYGYLPAMEALIGSAVPKLAPPCLPRALPLDADGAIACRIAEVSETSANVSCDSGGRKDADEAFAAVVLDHLESRRLCDGDRVPCREMVVCELQPAADLDGCLNDSSPAGSGYCYIDAMRDLNGDGAADCDLDGGDSGDCLGNPALVAECPERERRLLRFVGDVPARDALLVIGCVGAGSW